LASFYVDNSVSNSGNGSSWSSAWKSFSDINWSAVRAGDTIHVSGGTYEETLNVRASGSSGNPIRIVASDENGHNDPVVIDGENSRSAGVAINGQNHVEVSGFSIQNHAGAGVTVKNVDAGVVIENNDVYSGDPGGGNARGYDVRGSSGVIVRNNSFSTPSNTNAQTDGIWSSQNDGVVFENNRIIISNNNTNGHSDGVQSYQDYNVVIRNNYIEQANNARTDNHGMWLSDTQAGGVLEVTNNVVNVPNLTSDSAVTHWISEGWGTDGSIRLVGNTIYGGARALNLDNTEKSVVTDNILVPADGGYGIFMQNGRIPTENIDNNVIWAPNGQVAYIDGSRMSWSAWQNAGYDTNGANTDPQFVNAAAGDFSLQNGSSATGRGAHPGAGNQDVAEPAPEEGSEDVADAAPEEDAEAPVDAAPETPAENGSEDVADAAPEEDAEAPVDAAPETPAENGSEDVADAAPEEDAEAPVDAAPETPAENGSEDVADAAPEEDAEAPVDAAPETPAENGSEDVADAAPEEDAEAPVDAAPETPAENGSEDVADTTPDAGHGWKFDFSKIGFCMPKHGSYSFDFIGEHDFSGKAGEIRLFAQENDVIFEGDFNGDSHPDVHVEMRDLAAILSKAADYLDIA